MEPQDDYELEHDFSVGMPNKEVGSSSHCVDCRIRCTWQGANREGCEDFEGRDD